MIRAVCVAGGVGAVTVELLQTQPEWFPYGHELGEVVRNIGYALVTAYAFYYFLQERPARDRRRVAYRRNFETLMRLGSAGSRLLENLVRNQRAIIDTDVVSYEVAVCVVVQLSGRSEALPVTLSPFNALYSACIQIEESVKSLGHDENFMDDSVRQALKILGGLRERFKDDLAVKSVRLATGQTPLMEMPATLKAYEPMFMAVVDASRDLLRSLIDTVDPDLKPALPSSGGGERRAGVVMPG